MLNASVTIFPIYWCQYFCINTQIVSPYCLFLIHWVSPTLISIAATGTNGINCSFFNDFIDIVPCIHIYIHKHIPIFMCTCKNILLYVIISSKKLYPLLFKFVFPGWWLIFSCVCFPCNLFSMRECLRKHLSYFWIV